MVEDSGNYNMALMEETRQVYYVVYREPRE